MADDGRPTGRWRKWCRIAFLGIASMAFDARVSFDPLAERLRARADLDSCKAEFVLRPRTTHEAVFLWNAAEQMRAVHETTGRYPGTWRRLLEGKYVNPQLREIPDEPIWPHRRPVRGEGFLFPRARHFNTLTIERADATGFLLTVTDDRGRKTWRFASRDDEPKALAPALCRREEYAAIEGFVPQNFLAFALMDLRLYTRIHGRIPTEWGQQNRFHWSLEDHIDDGSERPPANVGRQWTPRGSRYTYINECTREDVRLRSSNSLGLPDYIVEGFGGEPTLYTGEDPRR